MKQKFLAFLALLMTVGMLAVAQNISVHGTVSDTLGNALPGVTVRLVGTASGTTTDITGAFTLSAPGSGTLEFSFIGYKTTTVAIGGRDNLVVRLSATGTDLNQVVVVGYGTQRKKDLTGAVSVVTAADIANRPIVNAGEALQGKAAGVQVTSNSGKPGAGLSIRVRGSSSISAGNDPLYVVDGIPMTDISSYSPSDFESISVLKDAASSSIYGTRAANGVVVITTKKGVVGKSKIDFSTYYGTTTPTKMLHVLNAQQYQALMNDPKAYGPNAVTDSMIAANDINWPDEVFRHGNQQNYHIGISGGSEKTQHYISLDYNAQTGMIRPSKFDRVTGRVNLSHKATNWLTVSTATIISRTHDNDITDNQSVARGGVVLAALGTPPTTPKYTPEGYIGQNPYSGWENPLGAIESNKTLNLTDRLVSNVGADVKFYKDLTFSSRFGIDYTNYRNTFFLDPFLTSYGRQQGGSLTSNANTTLAWLSEQTLNYSHSWGKSNVSALAGWTAQASHFQQTSISASRLPVEDRFKSWDAMFNLANVKGTPSTSIDNWALISYLGRINYDYDGKYLFQANIRSDNSSKFSPAHRTATFPSFSAGWRISQEEFMKNVTFINDLKLRAGWGQNGNQEGIGSYAYLSLNNINANNGSTSYATVAPEDLRWETSTQTNFGVDATFLDNRLSFTADVYWKKTENVLVSVPLSGEIVPNVLLNMGSMRNIGQEFVVSSKNIIKGDFKWNTDVNISFNKNEVLSIGNGISFMNSFGAIYERTNAIALVQGYGLGEFYGYVSAGVDPQTGLELYKTKDGKSVPYAETTPSDRKLIGNAQPKFVYGMTNTFSYKNFDLTVFIQGSQGNKIFNGLRIETEGLKDSRNQSTAVLHRWQHPGDKTDIPGILLNSDDNSQVSTRFLEDGSYLRFKTITLNYHFNSGLLNRIGLGAASVYISAQNLITITGYKGFDPEVNTFGTNTDNTQRNTSLGIDYGAYPQAKVFLAGLNITL
ncbi:MAG TPA: TonB-dependent receptor [Chitinophaga sp.]